MLFETLRQQPWHYVNKSLTLLRISLKFHPAIGATFLKIVASSRPKLFKIFLHFSRTNSANVLQLYKLQGFYVVSSIQRLDACAVRAAHSLMFGQLRGSRPRAAITCTLSNQRSEKSCSKSTNSAGSRCAVGGGVGSGTRGGCAIG